MKKIIIMLMLTTALYGQEVKFAADVPLAGGKVISGRSERFDSYGYVSFDKWSNKKGARMPTAMFQFVRNYNPNRSKFNSWATPYFDEPSDKTPDCDDFAAEMIIELRKRFPSEKFYFLSVKNLHHAMVGYLDNNNEIWILDPQTIDEGWFDTAYVNYKAYDYGMIYEACLDPVNNIKVFDMDGSYNYRRMNMRFHF